MLSGRYCDERLRLLFVIEPDGVPHPWKWNALPSCFASAGSHGVGSVPKVGARKPSHFGRTSATSGTFALVELGYARVSTAKQDLDRQIEALALSHADLWSEPRDRNHRWHRYKYTAPTTEIARLLEEIDRDLTGILWG